ncbi:hypothetical protein EYF80_020672 [Liparis tanakae]|uniref:Uncharacterized protein n=1 Tax=Liparis tanakae TaxID=230148 RepID=A0A4Z2HTF5_9TELE|nr:hypothetical protein EYF80_020672 [Liparis tanakae]
MSASVGQREVVFLCFERALSVETRDQYESHSSSKPYSFDVTSHSRPGPSLTRGPDASRSGDSVASLCELALKNALSFGSVSAMSERASLSSTSGWMKIQSSARSSAELQKSGTLSGSVKACRQAVKGIRALTGSGGACMFSSASLRLVSYASSSSEKNLLIPQRLVPPGPGGVQRYRPDAAVACCAGALFTAIGGRLNGSWQLDAVVHPLTVTNPTCLAALNSLLHQEAEDVARIL